MFSSEVKRSGIVAKETVKMLTEFTVLCEGNPAAFSERCSDRPGLVEGGVQAFEMGCAPWNHFCNGRTSIRV
jgi:hypothetical protein